MNLTWTKHSNEQAVVEITKRVFDFSFEAGFTDTGRTEVKVNTNMDLTTEAGLLLAVAKSWGKYFVSATLVGSWTRVWFVAQTNHGVADNKGRELGHRFVISRTRTGWALRPQATRAEVSYGACQREVEFETLVEAMVRADELAAKGKKAAAKAATRGGTKTKQ